MGYSSSAGAEYRDDFERSANFIKSPWTIIPYYNLGLAADQKSIFYYSSVRTI